MSVTLGLNAFHGDSSACIFVDGKLVAAAEEERFRRIKHWAGFPSESISFCLSEVKLQLVDIDIVAVNSNPRVNMWEKTLFSFKSLSNLNEAFDRLKSNRRRESIVQYFEKSFGVNHFDAKIKYVEHHHAHLASSHCVSPFKESVTASIDGLGDFVSTAWGLGYKNDIKIDGRIFFPHSLGIFYEAMTHYLGFKHYGDEYKVMGLAPLGKANYLGEIRKIINLKDRGRFELNLDYFSHQSGKVKHTWTDGIPNSEDCFGDGLIDLLGPQRNPGEELTQRHMDIAYAVQRVYEDAFFHLLDALYDHYKIDQLTLSGGCAMNSVANGKVYRRSSFKNIYIPPSAGDAGGAIGAAIVAEKEVLNQETRLSMNHAYWGTSFSNEHVDKLLSQETSELNSKGCEIIKFDDVEKLCKETANYISKGLVIGWFQGRMEWGPRALGNRSILCDPRRADMKDILNLKIKRRESFRPFAPAILRHSVGEWFEEEDDVPFMMQVFQIKKEQRLKIPAVTHLDGSGRLQTVTRESNSRYFDLISEFENITGVPILLNTSFNENEPVVCTPNQALNTFLRTKMDILVLNDFLISRAKEI